MPSPYQLHDRWLEGVWSKPMPDLESLKRQVDVVTREIERRTATQAAVDRLTAQDPVLAAAYDQAPFCQQYQDDTATLQDVLDTLTRLLPPF